MYMLRNSLILIRAIYLIMHKKKNLLKDINVSIKLVLKIISRSKKMFNFQKRQDAFYDFRFSSTF